MLIAFDGKSRVSRTTGGRACVLAEKGVESRGVLCEVIGTFVVQVLHDLFGASDFRVFVRHTTGSFAILHSRATNHAESLIGVSHLGVYVAVIFR